MTDVGLRIIFSAPRNCEVNDLCFIVKYYNVAKWCIFTVYYVQFSCKLIEINSRQQGILKCMWAVF